MTEDVSKVAPAAETPYPPRAIAWYATCVMAFLYWLSILDRFIISLMIDPIKADLNITDWQFSMLHGLAFAITFSLFGLIAGALADRFSRRWVIFAGVSVWSLATAACGLAANFGQMMLARVGVGMGEAALNPSASSMITDYFPKERLTSALAVYAVGSVLGSGCAYLFGGIIVDYVSSAAAINWPILGELPAWKTVFLVVGLPGVVLALLVFSFPEPPRRGEIVERKGWLFLFNTYKDLLKFLKDRKRFFMFHYPAFALASAIVTGTGTWFPAHLGRNFGWSASEIGITLGLIMAITGLIALLVCGRVVDALFARGYKDAHFRWYALCLAGATPLGVIGLTTDNATVFVVCICGFQVLSASLAACAISSLNVVTPGHLRASGVAFYGASAGLTGAAMGPMIIAAISDFVYKSENAIGMSMATAIGVCFPIAALLLWRGCKHMRAAVAMAD